MTCATRENVKPASQTEKVISLYFPSKNYEYPIKKKKKKTDGHILTMKATMELSARKNRIIQLRTA